MSKFRVVARLPLIIDFAEQRPTEKTAAYLAKNVGLCFIRKEGSKREVGFFRIEGVDEEIEIESVERKTKE